MRCEEIQDRLSEYIDGFANQNEISGHLEICPHCRKEYELLTRTITSLNNHGPEEAPLGLACRIQAHLLEESARRPRVWLTRGVLNRMAAIAAVFMIALILAASDPGWVTQPPVNLQPRPQRIVRITPPDELDYLSPDDLAALMQSEKREQLDFSNQQIVAH